MNFKYKFSKVLSILFILNICINICFFDIYSMQNTKKEDISLTRAVSDNDIDAITELIKEPLNISSSELKKAIFIAADKKNRKVFGLLSNLVSRTTHRKAYDILNK